MIVYALKRFIFLNYFDAKWGWQAYTTPTVRGISTFAVFFSVSPPFCRFTLVYEWHFVLCCKEKIEPSCYGKYVCLISAVICVLLHWVWHLCILPCISALFWLFSVARCVLRSPRICLWGTKYDVYCERVAYLHHLSWRRARLWLELFASTVVKLFSRVSHLPSYVFLLRRLALLPGGGGGGGEGGTPL